MKKIIGALLAGVGGILSLLGIFKSQAIPEDLMIILLSVVLAAGVFIALALWKKRKPWVLLLMLLPVAGLLVLHGIRLTQELSWTFECVVNLPDDQELISTFWYDQFMDYFIYVYTFSGLLIGSIGGVLLTLKSKKRK